MPICEAHAVRPLFNIRITHPVGISMWLRGHVVLQHGRWSQTAELAFGLSWHTQIFDTSNSGHNSGPSRLPWYEILTDGVDLLGVYSCYLTWNKTVLRIHTTLFMQQSSYLYCRSCSFIIILFIWVLCWKNLTSYTLDSFCDPGCRHIQYFGNYTLALFVSRVLGYIPGSRVLVQSWLLSSIIRDSDKWYHSLGCEEAGIDKYYQHYCPRWTFLQTWLHHRIHDLPVLGSMLTMRIGVAEYLIPEADTWVTNS